jgi:hypothetical protein
MKSIIRSYTKKTLKNYSYSQSLGLLKPDPGICEVSKNPIYDYYWGTELYPHLGPYISLKLLIICRFSLFLWQIIVLIAWKANFELNSHNLSDEDIDYPMTATTILQTIYLAKFYYWEDGYMAVRNSHIFYPTIDSMNFFPKNFEEKLKVFFL